MRSNPEECRAGGDSDAARRYEAAGFNQVHGWRSDELRDKGRRGLRVEPRRGIHLFNSTLIQNGDTLAECHRLLLIVRHVHHGGAEAAVQLDQLRPRVSAQSRIQIRQRFIEQECACVAHDGSADGHALALAAGQL